MSILHTVTLKDLPPPPTGKTGWPWTEQTEPLPERMPDGSEWTQISIVTPSYNQGQFIEETIRSVLLQGYSKLEYIIIDGGSTDNSVEIIKKYEAWLNYWVSEPDEGQTDAIQKGFNVSTGVIWNWINSDDLLEPNALQRIAEAYQNTPSATIYSGKLTVFGKGEPALHPKCFQNLPELVCVWEKWLTPQPSVFLSSSACREVNGLNTGLRYAMDYELYLRLAQLPGFKTNDLYSPVARFRLHSLSKTSSQAIAFKSEILQVFDEFARQNPSLLPKGWRKSRARCDYHSALDSTREVNNGNLSLLSFLKISQKFLLYIWDYRFFWASLFAFIKAYFSTLKKLQIT